MSKIKKLTHKTNKRKIWWSAAIIVVSILVLAQICIDVQAIRSMRTDTAGTDVMAQLIASAVDGLNKPAPVEASTGRVFIPDARLVMPPYTGAMGYVEYYYDGGDGSVGLPSTLHLTSSVIINMAKTKLWTTTADNHRHDMKDVFLAVPSLQACARGVQLFFSPQSSKQPVLVLQGSHQLHDGRTVYVYSEPACQQDQSAVIALANQAQSY